MSRSRGRSSSSDGRRWSASVRISDPLKLDPVSERAVLDATILAWADGLDPTWLEGDLTYYSGAAKRDLTRPRSLLVMHFFNHQAHHRGQVHCMLTQASGQPHATDLPQMPE